MADTEHQQPEAGDPRPRVLVLEANRAVQAALRKHLEEGGYEVTTVATADEAVEAVGTVDPEVVLAGAEAPERLGEAACLRLRAEVAGNLPVILLYAPGDDDAEHRAMTAGADSYLVAPVKKHAVLAAARDMLRIRALLDQIETLERRLQQVSADGGPEAGAATGGPAAQDAGDATGSKDAQDAGAGQGAEAETEPVYDFAFFKKLLLMEIKRSRRYAYPISLALVAFDAFPEVTSDLDARARGRLVGSLLATITKAIRDIDLPVLYAEDKVLVFMPHTPRQGALLVGGRLRDRIRGHVADLGDEERIRVTASIGVAAFEGQGTVSFGSLIKDATAALRRAQLDGGDRVEAAAPAPKSRVSIG